MACALGFEVEKPISSLYASSGLTYTYTVIGQLMKHSQYWAAALKSALVLTESAAARVWNVWNRGNTED